MPVRAAMPMTDQAGPHIGAPAVRATQVQADHSMPAPADPRVALRALPNTMAREARPTRAPAVRRMQGRVALAIPAQAAPATQVQEELE